MCLFNFEGEVGVNIIMAGSTGLIGGLLLQRLAGHDLTLIGRRANPAASAETKQFIGDVADWPSLIAGVQADVAICTLGTTMAQAGSKDAFAAVDLDAVIAFAKAAHACGARQFLMVSSAGANPKAGNFYLATKGQAEEGVRAIGFERVDIIRPGLLRGERGGTVRLAERLMIGISPITNLLTPRMFDHYRAIDADDVAGAMAWCIGKAGQGAFVHHNREMWTR
jgi:uncharacterized protein YbjT (DUF2867 family)